MNSTKKIILFFILFSNSFSFFLNGYTISQKERDNLDLAPGDTCREFKEKNKKFLNIICLRARGLKETAENIEKLEQELKPIPADDNKTTSSIELLSTYKIPIAIGSFFLSSYFCLLYKIHKKKQYVIKTTTWSCFKKHIPIDILHEIPEDKLFEELTNVIYRTFSENENNPDYNDIEPLYLFLKAAKKEITRLESFVNLYWYLKLPVISMVFPNFDDELLLAEEKIERLYYMHNLISEKLIAMNS